MCDFNRVSGFLLAAQAFYLATLVILIAAAINAGSPFTAVANVAAMIAAIATAALSTAAFSMAIAELDKCMGGPCDGTLGSLRRDMLILAATLATLTVLLIVNTVIAAIPFAGSVALGIVLFWATSAVFLFSTLIERSLFNTIAAFNSCQASSAASSNAVTTTIIQVTSVVLILGALTAGLGFIAVLWAPCYFIECVTG